MSRFAPEFLDKLRSQVSITDLIGRSVQWDKSKSNFAKRNLWATCPFHAEKTASFQVRDGHDHYHCFGCGKSGDQFTWLIEQQGLSFVEAVRHVADLAGVALPDQRPADLAAEARRASLLDVMAAADKWYRSRWQVKTLDGVADAAAYLKARGVTGETAKTFGIGFAPARGLLTYLAKAGFDEADMIEAGLAARNDRDQSIYERFRNRIMFPIRDQRGRVIAFGGRALKHGDKIAKYLNSPETDLYDKSRTLYNWNRARAAAAKSGEGGGLMLVVEGYLDAIAVHQAGFEAVVATCGTALTAHHLDQVWRHAQEPWLCFDGDAGGLKAADRTVDLVMPLLRPGQTVRVVTLPDGKDPDDMMGSNAGRYRFTDCLDAAVPLHEMVWSRLIANNDRSTPERQARFQQDIGALLADIDNGDVRRLYCRVYETRFRREFGFKVNLTKLTGNRRYGRARLNQEPRPAVDPDHGGAGGFAYAARQNPHPLKGVRGEPVEPPEMKIGHEADLHCASLGMTDLANSWRFIYRNGHRFRWSDELGWLAFDGRRWDMAGAQHMVHRAVEETITQIRAEAQALIDAEKDEVWKVKGNDVTMLSDALTVWCIGSQSAPKIRCVADLAKARLAVQPSQLDADPFKLTVLNGTLEFGRQFDDYVSFGPHDHNDLITKLAPVVYDPAATAKLYDKFLAQVQPERMDREYLHTVGGLCLTGDASVQALWFFYGKGRNGKSTLVEAWSKVMGDYAQSVPIETFLDSGRGSRTGDQATPHLVPLVGARLVRASEPEKGAKLSEGLIKEVTGGETMKVRQLNKPFFDFVPQFKLLISGNYRPEVKGTDDGIWRRMNLFPWTVQVPKKDIDPDLPNKLAGETSGILNHLIAGLQTYFLEGLRDTKAVQEATAAYREDSDPLQRFLDDCTEFTDNDDDRVNSTDLHELYTAWCKANGEHCWTPTGFGKGLREKGVRRRKASVMMWLGLVLIKRLSDLTTADPVERGGTHE